ncbi:transposase [Solwaraspora sp. WMMA2065]|uniref:transposase n=1 Tax=Solwaraspora sp. WMMA2065 TaxID=3015166 RepID=UPI00259B4FB0|nr:transposase [Solwaraspora sp. WMMA2065]WJK33095.1 transposase [Solwaraspora sp. WMMA2065]
MARGQEIQRLEKELEDTGMKLTSVITNVVGTTGRAIIDALIAGERDPQVLAGLAVGRARKKTLDLVAALDGTFTDHHGWMCRHYLAQIEHLDRLVGQLDQRIADLTAGHDDDIDNLDSPPGVGRRAAEMILAETGGDMTRFATAGHLASWIGVCPGMNESAGVTKRILGVAALAALCDRNSYYGVYYRRIAARRGGKKALAAVMHKLAIAIWHVLPTRPPSPTSEPTTSPSVTPNAP